MPLAVAMLLGGPAVARGVRIPARIAVARTGDADAVTPTAATLRGTITLHGSRVRHWFDYGTTRRYGTHTHSFVTRAARGRLAVAARVRGLPALARIHYRLVASTCGGCRRGTSYGPDRTLETGGYQNPLVPSLEGADPNVIVGPPASPGYWAYVTGDGFPVLHSADLVHWTPVGTTLARPSWVVPSGDWHPWAPDVRQLAGPCPGTTSANCYVMYYAGLNAGLDVNCIAVATATSPAGPFTDHGPLGPVGASGLPAGCGDATGLGEIDPSYFVDPASGAAYLYLSEDFSCPPAPSACTRTDATLQPTISVIPLAADGMSAAGARQPLFSGQAGSWEASAVAAPTVEGPAVIAHDGRYYLLYSGGSWHDDYGEGFAVASSPLGPFVKSPLNPVLRTGPGVSGVGGSAAPVRGPHGSLWVLYHGRGGAAGPLRALRIDPFSWAASGGQDVPVIWGPSTGPVAVQP